MKQEWFESNDFVKTTSKNKPDEQAQDGADKAEEKNTQLEEEVSQAEAELESQQEEKIETPENGEARTEIEEKKALEQAIRWLESEDSISINEEYAKRLDQYGSTAQGKNQANISALNSISKVLLRKNQKLA